MKETHRTPSGSLSTAQSGSVAPLRPLVARSKPEPTKNYKDYKDILRYDFFYMCAYCSIMETEAAAVPFTIDHYDPVVACPDAKEIYENLMYACWPCNSRKGDKYPPPSARAEGHRFFRPDRDIHPDHFRLEGVRLEGTTATGNYTIDALDLNRLMLRKLREFRLRKTAAEEYIAEGVAGLRRFHIDRLPREIRGRVFAAIRGTVASSQKLAEEIDSVLRTEARSPLLGDDPDPARAAQEDRDRKARLRTLEALFDESFRGRDASRKS